VNSNDLFGNRFFGTTHETAFSPTDLNLSNNSIDENIAANTVVGTFLTTDPNNGDTFTYQLVAGTGDTDNAAFTIVGNQLQINSSPDFETQSSYSILVQTTDTGGLSYSENLTININDIKEVFNLQLEFALNIGSARNEIGRSIAYDRDGNLWATGRFQDDIYDLTNHGGNDSYVAKFDSNGNLVKALNIGGSGYDQGNSIATDSNGNAWAIGFFSDSIDIDNGNAWAIGFFSDSIDIDGDGENDLISNGDRDGYVAKFKSNGDLLFAKNIGGKDDDRAFGTAIDSNGNAWVTGFFSGNIDIDGDGENDLISNGDRDGYVAKFDFEGNLVKASNLGGSSHNWSNSIATDSSGNAWITGFSQDSEDSVENSYVAKFSPDGNLVFKSNIGGNNQGIAIATDSKGNAWVTGVFSGSIDINGDGENDLTSNGGQDGYVAKFSPDGNLVKALKIGGEFYDRGEGIATDSNGNAWVTGAFQGSIDIDGDGKNDLTSNGGVDTYVAKFSSNGNLVKAYDFGGSGDDRPFDIVTDADGKTLSVTGVFQNSIDIDEDGKNDLTSNGLRDSYVIKFSTNFSPTDINLSNNSINEHVAANAVVGTFSTGDPDTGDTFTYQLVAGTGNTDNAAFTIDGDQLRINSSPDFETQSSYSILVQSTDPGGLSYSENLTININDVNDRPTDINLNNNSIDENVAPNTVVGTFSTTDPDTGDSFTYQLVAGTGDTDNAAFTIVGNQLRINSSPDFETQSSYSIRVQTTDIGGNRYSENLTININDIDAGLIELFPVEKYGLQKRGSEPHYEVDDDGVRLVVGTDNPDRLDWVQFEGGNELMFGGNGNDKIWGGKGNDTLLGEWGNDSLWGSLGDDTLDGGSGNDYLDGEPGNDHLYGGSGEDSLFGERGEDHLLGGVDDDFLNGGEGSDTLEGGDGNDTLEGGKGRSGHDSLEGGSGNDSIWGVGGHDTLDGGSGSDTLIGGTGDNEITGGSGDDSLKGEWGNDTLDGGSGHDTLTGGTGNDSITGGDGNDWIYASHSDTLVGGEGSDEFVLGVGVKRVKVNDFNQDDTITFEDAQGDLLVNYYAPRWGHRVEKRKIGGWTSTFVRNYWIEGFYELSWSGGSAVVNDGDGWSYNLITEDWLNSSGEGWTYLEDGSYVSQM